MRALVDSDAVCRRWASAVPCTRAIAQRAREGISLAEPCGERYAVIGCSRHRLSVAQL
jgi:hypothetical protein